MLIENSGTTDLSTTANNIGTMRNGVAMYRWAIELAGGLAQSCRSTL